MTRSLDESTSRDIPFETLLSAKLNTQSPLKFGFWDWADDVTAKKITRTNVRQTKLRIFINSRKWRRQHRNRILILRPAISLTQFLDKFLGFFNAGLLTFLAHLNIAAISFDRLLLITFGSIGMTQVV